MPGIALTLEGSLNLKGDLIMSSGGLITLPLGSVGDASVSASSPLGVDKTTHQINHIYTQKHGTAVASDPGSVIHIAGASGVVQSVKVAVRTIPIGAATVTVDIKKNGTSIMTGVVTIDNANVAYTAETGAITTTAYVVGDFFEAVLVATAGGGTLPQGIGVEVVFRETYTP